MIRMLGSKYYITVKAPPKLVCMKNTALGGVLRQILHLASPRAVFVSPHAVFFIQTRDGASTNTNSTTKAFLK